MNAEALAARRSEALRKKQEAGGAVTAGEKAKVAKKRTARPRGQGRPREVPFTIRDPASAVPLAAVSARDDPVRTLKLKGPMHPRPDPEEMAQR